MTKEIVKTQKMKPLFLITPGAMGKRDIRRAEKLCGICIAECKDPSAVRLLEPPIDAGMDAQTQAALALARMLVYHEGNNATSFTKASLVEWFTQSLMSFSKSPETVKKAR